MSERITLASGGGGKRQRELIERIRGHLSNPRLDRLEDGAVLGLHPGPGEELVVTTDSYIVSPLIFPGGDIGTLAVCGTVNDLAVMGAVPQVLTLGLIIEEGLELEKLDAVLGSIAARAREAGVQVVSGDTKVTERGKGDGLYINTAGVGLRPAGRDPGAHRLAPGQAVLVNGPLGDHSIAVMLSREGMDFEVDAASDCAPLNGLVEAIYDAAGPDGVAAMRDLTRGGLAAALNEYAEAASVDLQIDEEAVPVNGPVRAAARVLGFEPAVLANEGKLIVVVEAELAEPVLEAMQVHSYGRGAAVIGRVGGRFDAANPPEGRPRRPLVYFSTPGGGFRIVDMPLGELLPRIC